jgi:hypothetical protein
VQLSAQVTAAMILEALELELIHTQMAQEPMLQAMRKGSKKLSVLAKDAAAIRFANKTATYISN